MVSLSSLLLDGGWRKNYCVALDEGGINSPKGDKVKGGAGLGLECAVLVGPGRPAQARFVPGFLPGCFSCDSLFVCTFMWAFDVISFEVKTWILAIQASPFSGWVPEDLHVDAWVLGSFGVMFIACLNSCRVSWYSSKVLDELILKVSRGLVPVVRIINYCQH
jgi:hypothetical protein